MNNPTLSSAGKHALDEVVQKWTAGKTIPAVTCGSTSAKGILYEGEGGLRVFGDESSGEVNKDTTFQMFSMTKFITCVSALILVDRGQAFLDDPDFVEKTCPELAVSKLEILTGFTDDDKPILKPATKRITLRMLMSHTAGMAYPFMSPLLAKWAQQNPKPGMMSPSVTIDSFSQPLIYEPGESWKYSISIDWVGIIISRLSGLKLEDFFRQNIFDKVPGGMKDTSFFPRKDIMERLMQPCERADGEGELEKGAVKVYPKGQLTPVMLPRPTTPEEVGEIHCGGGGLFGTTRDYLAFLQTILACDPRHSTSSPLLSPSSYAELFNPCVKPDNASTGNDGHEQLAKMMLNEEYPRPDPVAETVDHSVGFSMNMIDSEQGRKKGSGTWAGACKTQFWLDSEMGIAGVWSTQLWAVTPDPWNKAYNDFESTLYKNLVV